MTSSLLHPKSLINAAALCLLVACGGGGGSESAQSPAPRTVEINADSIYSGTGLAERPALQLARLRPDWRITDKAVFGLALHSLVEGYTLAFPGAEMSPIGPQGPFADIPHAADIVVVQLGVNDAYNGSNKPDYTAERYEAELRGVIAAIRAQGGVPLLTGVVPFLAGDKLDQGTVERGALFNEVTIRLAAELSVPHARWDAVPFDGQRDTIDGLHRTQEAVDRLTARLAEAIDAIPKQPASAGFSLGKK